MKSISEKISIIIPAYNEAATIKENVVETIVTFQDFGVDFEIILIDDGSTDGTGEQIQQLATNYKNIKTIRNMKNFGKGRALKKGFRFAKGDYIIFLDADMDLHPGQIQTFFDIMRLDDADVVIGSKRHPNSMVNYSFARKIISDIYFFLIKVFFGLPIRDTQTGLKLFKRKVLREVFPKIVIKAFAYDLEILVNARKSGYAIAEAPVVLSPQRQFNRIKLRDLVRTGWDTAAIFYRMHILHFYDKKH